MGQVLAALFVAMLALAPAALAATPNTWTAAKPSTNARAEHVAALLPGGNVLVAGGESTGGCTTSTEIYHPSTNTWTAGAPMGTGRCEAAAVPLPSGKVLVVGGESATSSGAELNSAEVYDPVANTWTAVTNTMGSPRGGDPVAVLLPTGKVLVAGGEDTSNSAVTTADLYDPTANSFSATGAMSTPRDYAASTLLSTGKVLVAGGSNGSEVATGEVYNPATGTWAAVGNSMSSAREQGEAAALPGGRALVAGGYDDNYDPTATSDFYNAATNTFSAGPSMQTPRAAFGISTLHDGLILAAGGGESTGCFFIFACASAPTSTTELYDPATNSWLGAGPLPAAVYDFTTTMLLNGQVLGAGGTLSDGSVTADAELFTPPSTPGAPQSVSVSEGNRTANVTFSAPSSGGEPILGYTVTASTGQRVSTPATRTSVTVGGLPNGRRVTFTVTATNVLGTGAASAAVSVIPGPPTLRLTGVPRKLKLKTFLRGVKFAVTPNKLASLQVSLLATVNRATIARVYNLTLASKQLGFSSRGRVIRLIPSGKLVGHPRRALVQLVIVATDAAGLRSTTTRTITVVG